MPPKVDPFVQFKVGPDPFMFDPVAGAFSIPPPPPAGGKPRRVEINGPGMVCGDKSCDQCWRDEFGCPQCEVHFNKWLKAGRDLEQVKCQLADTRYFLGEIAIAVHHEMPGADDDERFAWSNMSALRNAVEAKMEEVNEKKTVDKEAHDAAIAKVEEERDTFDREADNLAAALEYVTIERDYLLNIVAWHEEEMLRLMERVEELEASNG